MQRDALFDLIARSPTAVCVVTSNRRLARALAAEFDASQIARACTAWETPQILPFGAFVAKLYDAAQHEPTLSGVRAPLTAAQEHAVWEAVVADSEIGLLSPATGASLASNAWSLAHQWDVAARMRGYTAGADIRAFINWSDEYRRRVDAAGATDLARLPDIVREHVSAGSITVPPRIVLAGFDDTTVQQQRLFDALEERGSICERHEPVQHATRARRAECVDQRDENTRVSDWAAARLAANPQARIGVVVPHLALRRRSLAAALDATLVPDRLLSPAAPRPYTFSLGGALIDVPLVAFHLRAARLALGTVEFEQASLVLRSPYLIGATQERDARDRLDAQMRRRCQRSMQFQRLTEAADVAASECSAGVPRLLASLRAIGEWRRRHSSRSQHPSEWASALAQLLQSISVFGVGERSMDSIEYQASVRWRELLAEFAALDRNAGPLASAAAIGTLERLAHETIFQPEGGAPPVQVLGVLEANALTFDHLWVMGLTADTWPPPARPDPLLPIELQRAVGMPGASATAALERARRQLQRLLQSAPEVIVSHVTVEADRKVSPSPLIASLEPWTPPPRAARFIDAITPVLLESSPDAAAPPWRPVALVRGGAAILQNQSACPFRAFAIHRLDARTIESPHDGFDYRERGQLVHDTLALFWASLPDATRDAIAATPEQRRRELLRAAADSAQARLQRRRGASSPALAGLERERLVRLIEQWLTYEIATRPAFRIVAIEDARTMHVGPLTVAARLDRVDESGDGSRIVIDYKTGNTKNIGWLDDRPDEPQLLMYLTASEPAARAIALAKVRAGNIGLSGFAATSDLLPGRSNQWTTRHASWSALVDHWSAVLERLAVQFAAGDAAVDPKRLPLTCRYCDLPTLCRINERGGAVIGAADDDEDGSPWVRDEE